MNSDIESVLFLISVHAYVNSRVQDSKNLTPLHIAVDVGSEIIVRNLVRTYITFYPSVRNRLNRPYHLFETTFNLITRSSSPFLFYFVMNSCITKQVV